MDNTEYKFSLIDHARKILLDAGINHHGNYEKKVLALAETIHAWVKKDLDKNETE
jgi:hypothetical protein